MRWSCPAGPRSASMPPRACRPCSREQGRGFASATSRVPIVPGAILFDLLNGGDKKWGRYPPYRELGYAAAAGAGADFALGTAGAAWGRPPSTSKAALGSASALTPTASRSARSPP